MLGHLIMKQWEGRGVQVKGNTSYRRLSRLQTLQVILVQTGKTRGLGPGPLAVLVDLGVSCHTKRSGLEDIEHCIVWMYYECRRIH